MYIDALPLWALFLITVLLIFLAVEIGFRIGGIVRNRVKDKKESTASSSAGVILGLLAFMLAFTFNSVASRYENKKLQVREEANVIRTAWQRTDLLQEPGRTKARELLQGYLDERIQVAKAGDMEDAKARLDDAVKSQGQLWEIAVANARLDMSSEAAAMFLKSVNDISEIHATRVGVGLLARLPTAIWIVLYSILMLGLAGVGYHTAIVEARRSYVTPILAAAFSLVVCLIATLDHPGSVIMPVSQQALINVQSEMRSVSQPSQ